jgi:hypothetical protein
MKSLLKLLLNDNQLSGNIPSEIVMLSVLTHIDLATNNLNQGRSFVAPWGGFCPPQNFNFSGQTIGQLKLTPPKK